MLGPPFDGGIVFNHSLVINAVPGFLQTFLNSISQLAGDLMSKRNFVIKYLSELLVFQIIFLKLIFSVAILILIWPKDKVLQTPTTHPLFPLI